MPSTNTINQVKNEITSSSTKDNLAKQANQAGGIKTPQEQPEYIKQALAMIEKKVRNLDKRRLKLEEYKEIQKKGTALNEDQLLAVSKYEEVKTCLEMAKDLDKQLISLANDALKAQKKQAKKDQIEREESLREKLKEVQKIRSFLNSFNDESVRQDFLNENNGAFKMTKEELDLLDEFYKATCQPKLTNDNEFNDSVEHFLNLIDGKSKAFLTTTYTEMKKLFDKILASSYWSQEKKEEQKKEETVNYQQNVSTDDFVIVSSNEIENNHVEQEQEQVEQVPEQNSQSQPQMVLTQQLTQDNVLLSQQQPQTAQTTSNPDQRTFFSTLNAPDHYVHEFLSENNEGLNFLQDSQVQGVNQPQQNFNQNSNTNDSVKNSQSNPTDYSVNTTVFTNQKFNQYNQESKENNQYGGYKQRNNNGDQSYYQPRNNNGNNNGGFRRTYSDDQKGPRGGYSNRGEGRGGRGGSGGPRGNGRGGGYRGKPRGAGNSRPSNEVYNESN